MPKISFPEIAGYVILDEIARSAMSTVYRARKGGTPVVIKLPTAASDTDDHVFARFTREVQATRELAHPHIIPILDWSLSRSTPFLVTKYMAGGTLSLRRPRTRDGRIVGGRPTSLASWLPAIAHALDYTHARGVVHRDIKPRNIFFDAHNRAYLADFGLAKGLSGTTNDDSASFLPGGDDNPLTSENTAVGTIAYMAPERFLADASSIDGRADQYSLAVVLYEILAGHRPFAGTTAHVAIEHTTRPPRSLTSIRRDLPRSLSEAVMRGLMKNPGDRFPTCSELASAALADLDSHDHQVDTAIMVCPNCRRLMKFSVTAAGRSCRCEACQAPLFIARDLSTVWTRGEHEALLCEETDLISSSPKGSVDDGVPRHGHPTVLGSSAAFAFGSPTDASDTYVTRRAGRWHRRVLLPLAIATIAITALPLLYIWMIRGSEGGAAATVAGIPSLQDNDTVDGELQPPHGFNDLEETSTVDPTIQSPLRAESDTAVTANADETLQASAMEPPDDLRDSPAPDLTTPEPSMTRINEAVWNDFVDHMLSPEPPPPAQGSDAVARFEDNFARTIPWRVVGFPDNPPDQTTGAGSVAFEYAITAFEITNDEYCAFLNASHAGRHGLHGLADGPAHPDSKTAGITAQEGDDGRFRYATRPGMALKPVTGITPRDAARFANWLHNGGMVNSDTENGAYDLEPVVDNEEAHFKKNDAALFWIPSFDEWYKAAYHSASDNHAYYRYATGSNEKPARSPKSGNTMTNVNYGLKAGIGSDAIREVSSGGGMSPYGLHHMAGNVAELVADDLHERFMFCGGDYTSPLVSLAKQAQRELPVPEASGFRLCRVVDDETRTRHARWKRSNDAVTDFESAKSAAGLFASSDQAKKKPAVDEVLEALDKARVSLQLLNEEDGNDVTQRMVTLVRLLTEEFLELQSLELRFEKEVADVRASSAVLTQLPAAFQQLGNAVAANEMRGVFQELQQRYDLCIKAIRERLGR